MNIFTNGTLALIQLFCLERTVVDMQMMALFMYDYWTIQLINVIAHMLASMHACNIL